MSLFEVTAGHRAGAESLARALPFRYGAGSRHTHRTAIMRRIGMAVLGLALVATPGYGQRSALREVRDGGSFGVNVVVAQPLGEFRRNGDVAAGLSVFGVTSGSALALRVDGSWMAYDAQYQGNGVRPLSQIGTIAPGPQLPLGQGPLRFYGFPPTAGPLFWSSAGYGGGGCSGGSFLD